MMGPAPGCPSALRPKLELRKGHERKARRLALTIDQGWATLEADVVKAVRDAALVWQRAGFEVEEIALDLEIDDGDLRETIEKALFSTAIGAELIELDSKKQELTSYGRRFVE